MHNFVLACPTCNRSKSDTLAAKEHLENWLERSNKNFDAIMEIGEIAGVSSSLDTSMSIAKWAYELNIQGGGTGWIRPNEYEPVSKLYLNCLSNR
jgi:hypothetical protein